MQSAWEVADCELTPAGARYIVVLGQREWIVLHAGSGWQFWNGTARCEANAGVREAILRYERENDIVLPGVNRRWTSTTEDIEDFLIRTGYEG